MRTKEQRRETWRRWYHRNKAHRTSYKRRRYAESEEVRIKHLARHKEWAKRNPEHIKAYNRKWVAENLDHVREVRKKYHQDHAAELAQYRKEWKRKNRKRCNALNERWRRLNPDKDKETKRKWAAKKAATDLNFKLRRNLRHRIADAMRQRCLVKSERTVALVGCSIESFKSNPYLLLECLGKTTARERENGKSTTSFRSLCLTYRFLITESARAISATCSRYGRTRITLNEIN